MTLFYSSQTPRVTHTNQISAFIRMYFDTHTHTHSHSVHSAISVPSTSSVWMIPSRLFPLLTAFTQQLWSPRVKCVSVPSSTNSPCGCRSDKSVDRESNRSAPYCQLWSRSVCMGVSVYSAVVSDMYSQLLWFWFPLTLDLTYDFSNSVVYPLLHNKSGIGHCSCTYCSLNILSITPNIHGVFLWKKVNRLWVNDTCDCLALGLLNSC